MAALGAVGAAVMYYCRRHLPAAFPSALSAQADALGDLADAALGGLRKAMGEPAEPEEWTPRRPAKPDEPGS